LGSAAEVAWRVGALSIGAAIEAASTDQIATSEAVQLFVERAQAVRPEFRLTEQNASAIVRICRRLDALPLAIELAAARVNVLDVLQIEERVDDRFHLLATGLRTAAARQRTLHATLDWSYDLLPETERRVFERLSVFASGCSLNAAEAVCATNGVAPAEVLDRLGQLVDKSLVWAEPQADETLWLRLLETPRQYGRERLAERGELESTIRRQVDWYVQLASQANNGMRFGDGQAAWLARLDREHDNLRSVLTWAIGHVEADVALRLGAGLWRFWHYRGHLDEGRAWLQRTLALQGTLFPARLVVLLGAGIMAQAQGDVVAARAYHEEQLALATGPEAWTWRAAALTQLGHLTFGAGDLRRARSLYRRGLAIWEQHEDRWGAANCLDGLAHIALRERHYPQARQLVQRALIAYQTTHDEIQQAGCHCLLGQADLEEGKLEPARARFRASLTILKGLGVSVGTVRALVGSARLALAEGRYERAVHLLGAVSTQRVRLGVATDWDAREEAGPARQALGDATTQAAMAAGGTLSLVQAVAYALEEYDPWPAPPTTSSSGSWLPAFLTPSGSCLPM
jgi:non-specific serine/threonine protein kinase